MRLALASALVLTACIGDPVFVGGEPTGGGGVGGATSTTTTVSTTTSTGEAGATTTGPTGECGNWVVEAGEECEDGNRFPGDGCSPDCLLEAFCGNDVVEPGEKCDGVECDAMCEPLPTSECAGANELVLGPVQFTSGPAIADWGMCANEPARFVGWVDTGPIPMRLALRYLGTSDNYRLGLGCQQSALTSCDATEVTEPLPPHSIVWLTAFTPNEADQRTVHVFRTRFGSWLNTSNGGLSDGGGAISWAWTSSGNGYWSVAPDGVGQALLVSPPVDLSGIETATVHFHGNFQAGGGATGAVEYSLDGMTWLPAGVVANGENEHIEYELPGAEGQPSVRVRWVFDSQPMGSWTIQNVFIGPPVPT